MFQLHHSIGESQGIKLVLNVRKDDHKSFRDEIKKMEIKKWYKIELERRPLEGKVKMFNMIIHLRIIF